MSPLLAPWAAMASSSGLKKNIKTGADLGNGLDLRHGLEMFSTEPNHRRPVFLNFSSEEAAPKNRPNIGRKGKVPKAHGVCGADGQSGAELRAGNK